MTSNIPSLISHIMYHVNSLSLKHVYSEVSPTEFTGIQSHVSEHRIGCIPREGYIRPEVSYAFPSAIWLNALSAYRPSFDPGLYKHCLLLQDQSQVVVLELDFYEAVLTYTACPFGTVKYLIDVCRKVKGTLISSWEELTCSTQVDYAQACHFMYKCE